MVEIKNKIKLINCKINGLFKKLNDRKIGLSQNYN